MSRNSQYSTSTSGRRSGAPPSGVTNGSVENETIYPEDSISQQGGRGPRSRAGYGPWHNVLFGIFGMEFECQGEGNHAPGGDCERSLKEYLLGNAREMGYQGPLDPQEVQRFLMPYRDDILAPFAEQMASLGCELDTTENGGSGGGPPILRVRDSRTGQPIRLPREYQGGRYNGY